MARTKRTAVAKPKKAIARKTKTKPCAACLGSGQDDSSGDVKSCLACGGAGLTN